MMSLVQQQLTWLLITAHVRGPIHRHCPKIYLKTCHKIIL